jgi:hypothetical protein
MIYRENAKTRKGEIANFFWESVLWGRSANWLHFRVIALSRFRDRSIKRSNFILRDSAGRNKKGETGSHLLSTNGEVPLGKRNLLFDRFETCPTTSLKLSNRVAQVQEYFSKIAILGQKSLQHKELRQKDFSRFSAISARRKRAVFWDLVS